MKRYAVLIIALIFLSGLAGCTKKSMNYIIENEPNFTGVVEETYENSILVSCKHLEGHPGEVKAFVSLNTENKDSMTHFNIGDEVVVYYDGVIAESSPLQVNTVYAITLKTPAVKFSPDVSSADESETVTEVPEKETDTATETEETTVTEIKKKNNYGTYLLRTREYMEQLDKLEIFNEMLLHGAGCTVCDLDSDGTPEVIIEHKSASPVSAVFSVDEDGAFMAKPNGGTFFTGDDTFASYDGYLPVSFIFMEQDCFFAHCFSGGNTAGQGGIIKLVLNGRKLSSEAVGEWSFGLNGTTYRGFEDQEQYNTYIKDYFGRLEPQFKLMPTADWSDLNVNPSVYMVAKLLDEYFKDRDKLAEIDGMLADDVKFKTEFKLTEEDYNCEHSDSCYIYDYDYAGTPLKDDMYYSFSKSYGFTYYPDGTVKTKTIYYDNGKRRVYHYDEKGEPIKEDEDKKKYDELGRVSRLTEYSDGDVYCTTEFFYNGDTDEAVRKICTYDTGVTETVFYENGLDVRMEKNVFNETRVYLKEYTADGLISKYEMFDGEVNTARTIVYRYDEEGRLVYEKSETTTFYWDESDRCNDYVQSREYNENGELNWERFDAYGGTQLWEYEYDSDGNLIRYVYSSDHDNEMVGYEKGVFESTYTYEYDLAGNPVKRIEKCPDGEIITRYRPVRVIVK